MITGLDEFAESAGVGGGDGGRGAGWILGTTSDGGHGGVGGGEAGSGGGRVCLPGELTCDGGWVVRCSADGELVYEAHCPAESAVCVEGYCESGLAARWGFDEGAGDTASDDVDGIVAELVGPATWDGGAIDLSNGGHLTTAGADVLNEALPVSLSAWVNVSVGASGTMVVAALDNATLGYAGAWMSLLPDSGNRLAAGIGDATGTGPSDRNGKTSDSGFPAGTWTHIAVVVHGPDAMDLYIDGEIVDGSYGGTASSVSYTTSPPSIGAAGWGGATFQFLGQLDDVRVYRRALTPADVARLSGGSR